VFIEVYLNTIICRLCLFWFSWV